MALGIRIRDSGLAKGLWRARRKRKKLANLNGSFWLVALALGWLTLIKFISIYIYI